MKTLLMVLSLSVPTLSFACINLTGSYTDCKANHTGDDKILALKITQSTPKANFVITTQQETTSSDVLLDGIGRTEVIDIEGYPAYMTTTASCDNRMVSLSFSLEIESEVITSGMLFEKDSLGQLVITETLEGDPLSQTTCEPLN